MARTYMIPRPRLLTLAVIAAGLLALGATSAAAGPPPSWGAAIEFASLGLNPQTPTSVATADIDGNGAPDLVFANAAADAVSILLFDPNQGPVTGEVATGGDPRAVAIGDLTGDGRPDLAVANFSGSVSVLTNTASVPYLIGFSGVDIPLSATHPTAVAIGDLDGDGLGDIAVANDAGTVSVLYNEGPGPSGQASFRSGFEYALGSGPVSLAIADVDRDSDDDLVVADQSAGLVQVLAQSGGTLAPAGEPFSGGSPTAVQIADLNADTLLDLAVVNATADTVSVALGTGGGAFASPRDFPTGASPQSMTTADLNGDGTLDLVTANASGSISWLAGKGDGDFRPKIDTALPDVPGSLASGDFDYPRDGRSDLAIAAPAADRFFVVPNQAEVNTGVGANIRVQPLEPWPLDFPITSVTFANVTAQGTTWVETSQSGPAPPTGFEVLAGQYYDLGTTAQFDTAEVCFLHTWFWTPEIAQRVGGSWQILLPKREQSANEVCADASSFSQFALLVSDFNTDVGSSVVQPVDPVTGISPVRITFAGVTARAATWVTSSSSGPPLPAGFQLEGVYYALSTTAQFTDAEVCFVTSNTAAQIQHFENGAWTSLPSTSKLSGGVQYVCAAGVTSFSPFALAVPPATGDGDAPVIACGSADSAWHGANVSIPCTARDDGSGLADSADAAFSLSTSVPLGAEDGNAPTGSRQVCDVAGNCATAGPIGEIKVDRKAPVLSLPADKTVDATSPAGGIVSFVVTASDGAHPSPAVSCSPPAGSTFAIGSSTVACIATDHVGNTANGSFTVTVRGAKEQLSRLIQKVVDASTLPPATKTQLIAKLQSLVSGFDPTKPAQRQAVCSALKVFGAAVQLLSGHGIPAAQAADWIADTNRIRAVLSC